MKLYFSTIIATVALFGNTVKLAIADDSPVSSNAGKIEDVPDAKMPVAGTLPSDPSPMTEAILSVEFISAHTTHTPEEQAFMQTSLLDTFHMAYDSSYGLDLIDVQYIDETFKPVDDFKAVGVGGYLRAAGDWGPDRNKDKWDQLRWELVPQMRCTQRDNKGRRICPPRAVNALEALLSENHLKDAVSADAALNNSKNPHKPWAKKLCKRLREGSFEAFNDVMMCNIYLKSIPISILESGIQGVVGEIEEVQAKSEESVATTNTQVSATTSPDGDDSSTTLTAKLLTTHHDIPPTLDEQAFLIKSIIDSFHMAHNPIYGVDLVDLTFISEAATPINDVGGYLRAAGDWGPDRNKDKWDQLRWELVPQMRCTQRDNKGRRICPPRAVNSLVETLISESHVKDAVSADAAIGNGKNPHKAWEKVLCKTLKEGPFDYFHDAMWCKIDLMTTTNAAELMDPSIQGAVQEMEGALVEAEE
jgi:hypothetical protein